MNDPTQATGAQPEAPTQGADADPDPNADADADADADGNTIRPLPGEPGIPQVGAQPRMAWSKKGLLAVALLVGSLILVSALSLQRLTATNPSAAEETALMRDQPSAATAGTRKLDMAPATPPAPRIPALLPAADAVTEPIGVRRTTPDATGGALVVSPQDAPVVVVSSRPSALGNPSAAPPQAPGGVGNRATTGPSGEPIDPEDPLATTARNLQDYQRQIQGLLDDLTRSTALATGQTDDTPASGAPQAGAPGMGAAPTAPGLFGGQLQASTTPRVVASRLGERNLTLPKGTAFTCVLKTRVISATSGLVGCQVQRHVYGDSGRVLLIERGSHLDGEYRIASVRPGMVRIPVLWTRIRTPHGVTVDIESPGTGPLGESGIEGFVDNRWGERIGAAMLLSLIDDSVKLVIQNQTQDQQADTVVLPSTTDNTSKLAEKVLDSTINIPPLLVQNQGGIVGIYVARDVDFSSVYELQPNER